MAKGEKLKGFKRKLFDHAVALSMQYDPCNGNSAWYRWQLSLMSRLVFSKWREALGGRMRVIVSGGAALQPYLVRIFASAGIPVLDGCGLTGVSPVIAVNTLEPGGMMPGTVGKVITDVQIRISENGEFWQRAKCDGGLLQGPGLTAMAIDDEGWFHTTTK